MEERNCPMCSQRKKERSPEEYKKLINRLQPHRGSDPRHPQHGGKRTPTVTDILVQSAAVKRGTQRL